MSQDPLIERLEEVRESEKLSIRAFWERVVADWQSPTEAEPPSYESARYYHKDRQPPNDYLVNVARTFGRRLEWLVAGMGPQTEVEAALQPPYTGDVNPPQTDKVRATHDASVSFGGSVGLRGTARATTRLRGANLVVTGFAPTVEVAPVAAEKPLQDATRALLTEAVRRYVVAVPAGKADATAAPEIRQRLLSIVLLPLELAGFKDAEGMSSRELNDYVTAGLHALMLAIPERGRRETGDKRAEGFELRYPGKPKAKANKRSSKGRRHGKA